MFKVTVFGASPFLKHQLPTLLLIEGKLSTRKWTDKDGNERFTTEIRADGIQLLGKREEAKPHLQEESPALKALKAEDNPEQDLPF